MNDEKLVQESLYRLSQAIHFAELKHGKESFMALELSRAFTVIDELYTGVSDKMIDPKTGKTPTQ